MKLKKIIYGYLNWLAEDDRHFLMSLMMAAALVALILVVIIDPKVIIVVVIAFGVVSVYEKFISGKKFNI